MASPPAFALLHGGGQGSWVWDEVVPLLEAKGAHVLALDAPGCGTKRGRDTSLISMDDIDGDLIADIEAAGCSKITLVGHSQAGTTLPRLLEKRPDLFSKVIYVSCCAPAPGQTIMQMIGASVRGVNPDEVGWIVPLDANSPVERYRAMFCNDMSEAEADAFLAKLGLDNWPRSSIEEANWRYDHLAPIPSTYILCEQDTSLPPLWQERFAMRLHSDKIVRINAGHQVMNTQPEQLANLLLQEMLITTGED
jgi:pimeloyl-ACP methyl ester carboxylesterase